MGQGVILRVGDRTSIFDNEASRYLTEVAELLKRREPRFGFQRALMSGGTCEGTAFQTFGLKTAALCVALGNYHNCGKRGKIETEFVCLDDACGMARLSVEAALQMRNYSKLTGKLQRRLEAMARSALTALRKAR
jgi:endoglucanase